MLGVIIPPVNVQGGAGPPFLAMAILRRRLGTDTQCESSISLLVKREGPVFMAALSLFGPGWVETTLRSRSSLPLGHMFNSLACF